MKRKNPVNAANNQIKLRAAAIMVKIFLDGLALDFNFNSHDLEEITRKALFEPLVEIKSDAGASEAADSEAS